MVIITLEQMEYKKQSEEHGQNGSSTFVKYWWYDSKTKQNSKITKPRTQWIDCMSFIACVITLEGQIFGITLSSAVMPITLDIPDNKLHGANMGPIWSRQDPSGPHVGPMNLTIWISFSKFVWLSMISCISRISLKNGRSFYLCKEWLQYLWLSPIDGWKPWF